jgi:aminoglycoside phosphotransferase
MLEKIKYLQLDRVSKAPIGFSGDQVYMIKQGYHNQDVVVKLSRRKDVYEEGKNLQWLADKIRVPKVYEIGKIEDYYYVIMEQLPGQMLQEAFEKYAVDEVIFRYAKAVRAFHDTTMENIPYSHSLAQKLEDVKANIEQKKITSQYFEREFKMMTPEEVYQLLLTYTFEEEDKVLCHGDVCMPNMIYDEHFNIGYIDVVQLGISDRYLDIAIGLRSLRYNLESYGHTFTKEHIEIFKQGYGISSLSVNKIMFYILLDELMKG